MGGIVVAQCQAGNTADGFNITMSGSNVIFTNNVSEYAVCGSGFVSQDQGGAHDIILGTTFAYNGVHNENMMWADGLTIHGMNNAQITNNVFIDNTDVDFILGGCQNCAIQRNSVTHDTVSISGASYAAIMIQAWSTDKGAITGNYAGSDVAYNSVDCGLNKYCGFGFLIGADPWYIASVSGGNFHDNTIKNARQGFEIASAHNLAISNNIVTKSGGKFEVVSAPSSEITADSYDISPASSNVTIVDSSPVVYSNKGWPTGRLLIPSNETASK